METSWKKKRKRKESLRKRHRPLPRLVNNNETRTLTCPPDFMPAVTCKRQVSCLTKAWQLCRSEEHTRKNHLSPQLNAAHQFSSTNNPTLSDVTNHFAFLRTSVFRVASALRRSAVWQLLCELLRENGSGKVKQWGSASSSCFPVICNIQERCQCVSLRRASPLLCFKKTT